MSKKQIADRRERNRQIAAADALQRCRHCKRKLPEGYLIVVGAAELIRYCNPECQADATAEREMRHGA